MGLFLPIFKRLNSEYNDKRAFKKSGFIEMRSMIPISDLKRLNFINIRGKDR